MKKINAAINNSSDILKNGGWKEESISLLIQRDNEEKNEDNGLDENSNLKTTDIKSFSYLENNSVTYTNVQIRKTQKKLDAGAYSLITARTPSGCITCINILSLSKVKTLPSFPKQEYLDKIIQNFYNKNTRDKLKKSKTPLSFGFLLHGKEGTGKTSIVSHYLKKLIDEENAIVFILEEWNCREFMIETWDFIKKVRAIQNNPIIVFIDECEELFENRESTMKTILDGTSSIDDLLFFCCTNYPERIPNTIKNRPSRIKYNIEIQGIDEIHVVKDIIKQNIPDITDDELDSLSMYLKGHTVDEVKQKCVDIIMGLDEFEVKNKIGFKSK